MSEVASAGDHFIVSDDEAAVRDVAAARKSLVQQAVGLAAKGESAIQASSFIAGAADKREQLRVPIVLKADSSGSLEAIRNNLISLNLGDDSSFCVVDIVSVGVGPVTTSDVAIAGSSGAKIVAFKVASAHSTEIEAKKINVPILSFEIVYDLLKAVESDILKTLNPAPPGELIGRAEILKVFDFGKSLKIAGCKLLSGTIKKDANVRILRGKRNTLYTGRPSTLRSVKLTLDEVVGDVGTEFGMSFDGGFNEFEAGDVVECFVEKDRNKII